MFPVHVDAGCEGKARLGETIGDERLVASEVESRPYPVLVGDKIPTDLTEKP